MHRYRVLAAVGLLVAALPLAGQPTLDVDAGRRLAHSALVDGRSHEYVAALTGTFGSRLTGSPSYQHAVEWAIAQFKTAYVDSVAAEPFTIAHTWQRGGARGRIVAPLDRPLHLASIGWMPSTPEGGVAGDVALVTDLAPKGIAATRLKGRIALVVQDDRGDEAARLKQRNGIDERLRGAGAMGILWPEDGPGNVLAARSSGFGSDVGVLPSAQVGHEDAQLIRRLLVRGPVRVAFDLHNAISAGPVPVDNVIAEIRGRERPGEWVIVGAHLDSWDFATGAQDNGTGVAMVLDAARAIAALGRPPRRSIRFALWGGEEQGLIGSTAYVRAHAADLVHCIAAINTDGGSARVLGFVTPGRPDVAAALRPISQTLLADLGAGGIDLSTRYAFESDHAPFILEGIPALDLNPDDAKYEEVHHTAADTLDKIDWRNLAIGSAAIAIAAYAIADAEQPFAPHEDRAAVAAMLAAAHVERLLEVYGLWKREP